MSIKINKTFSSAIIRLWFSIVPSVETALGRHWLNTGAVLLFSVGKLPALV